jgi:hypothetical protein
MSRITRAFWVLFLSMSLVTVLGCGGLFNKDTYWDTIKEKWEKEAETSGVHDNTRFLGIRTRSAEVPYQVGVPVLHVFAGSPAAAGGLQKGDEIRSIGGQAVRTADDLRALLTRTNVEFPASVPQPPMPVASQRLVYARDGQEYSCDVHLVSLGDWRAERRRRLFSDAQYTSAISIPFFFNKSCRVLMPEFVAAYFGVTIDEALLLYRDFDVLPVILDISLFRIESMPLVDGGRYTLVTPPLRVTTENDDRTLDLHGLIPAPPEGTSDL